MIKHYPEIHQGTDEWHAIRCGLLTASEMKRILTATRLQYANNDHERAHVYEIAAQRINRRVEPSYITDDMLRGIQDEEDARSYYHENYAPVEKVGFITNDRWGFTLGYSPDGLVGTDGLIEIKCPRQKTHLQTIIDQTIPDEHVIQVQTGLLVSERKWCDFITFNGGWPMTTIRVYPDQRTQEAIVEAAKKFHDRVEMVMESYRRRLFNPELKLIQTERKETQELLV